MNIRIYFFRRIMTRAFKIFNFNLAPWAIVKALK
jgi:hypothetical protein